MPTMIKKYLKDKQGNYLAPFTTADMVEHADGETTEVKLQTLENQVGDTVLTTTAQNVTDAINELNTEIVGAKTDVTPTTYNSLGERLDAMDVKIAAASGGQAPDVTKAYVDQQDDDIKTTIGTLGDLATDEQTSIVLSINELHDEAITCEDYTGTTTTVADLSTRVTDLEVDNVSIVQELEDSHTDSNGVVHGTIGQRLDNIEGDLSLKRDDLAPGAGGSFYQGTPLVNAQGVMEVGRFIDFHFLNNDTADYSQRLESSANWLECVGHFCSGSVSGTFNLGSDTKWWGRGYIAKELYVGDNVNTGSIVLGGPNVLSSIQGINPKNGTKQHLIGYRGDYNTTGDRTVIQIGGAEDIVWVRTTENDGLKVVVAPIGGNFANVQYTVWHEGNVHKNKPGAWWSGGPVLVPADGVTEVGKYMDFHASHTSTADHDVRLTATTGSLAITGNFNPIVDNYHTLGHGNGRWAAVYAVNGTIQTSDMKHKTDIRDIDDNIFYNMIKNSGVHSYVLNYENMPENITQETAPIEQIHVGIIAQELAQNEGWEYVLNTTIDENGEVEYSVNNYNLTSAIMAALKIEISKREELEQENQELRAEIEAIKAHVGL